jgi:Cytotoxic
MTYIPPPKTIRAFPGLRRLTSKTPVRGGGKLRKRWKDRSGNIYEWDGQHGRLEKYNARGKHLGEYDPETGIQTKPADPTRTIEP